MRPSRIAFVAIASVAAFSWINRRTLKLPVRPYN